jgi:pimeloyl-ACP methyl ester carboxylesterase
MYFERTGATGTPMLFLHSTPEDHRLWMYQTARFGNWYRTIAPDLPGYGRSPPPRQDARIADLAAACWETVDTLTNDPIIVHGNSLGGNTAMHMARQRPERTLALILSGCGYLPTREPMQKWKARYESEGIALRRGQILDHYAPATQATPFMTYYADMLEELTGVGTLQSIIAINTALLEVEPDDFFLGIKCPTTIIIGSLDRTLEPARALAAKIPGAEFNLIEGAGHSCNFENPGEYDRLCIEFLTRHGLFPG